MSAAGARVRPTHRRGSLAAPALKTRPGDNLMIHKAIELALHGEKQMAAIAEGRDDRSWVDETLTRLNWEIET
ncbi:hypothetical protein JQ543_01460 [Bradyrhizobium diazoefficiens]|nr:hypothetical protein [Bradyrhizobium diazoefficiens]